MTACSTTGCRARSRSASSTAAADSATGACCRPALLRPLQGGQSWRLSQFAGCQVDAVAGIANPQRFFDLLRHARIKVIEHPFPDHHAYTPRDFEFMSGDLPVLMTEKDAVKCRGLGLENAWFLTVDAVLPSAWEAALVKQVRSWLTRPGKKA